MKTFFVLGMPRSGTAWLSNFLTWGDSFCLHEATYGCESLIDLQDAFIRTGSPTVGMADTAAIVLADALNEHFPGSRFLFVVRDLEEVKRSLNNRGFDVSGVDALGQFMGHAIRNEDLDSMTVSFDRLFNQNNARVIWDFLRIPGDFPVRRFELLRQARVENIVKFNPSTDEAKIALSQSITRFSRLIESVKSKKEQQPSQRGRM